MWKINDNARLTLKVLGFKVRGDIYVQGDKQKTDKPKENGLGGCVF